MNGTSFKIASVRMSLSSGWRSSTDGFITVCRVIRSAVDLPNRKDYSFALCVAKTALHAAQQGINIRPAAAQRWQQAARVVFRAFQRQHDGHVINPR